MVNERLACLGGVATRRLIGGAPRSDAGSRRGYPARAGESQRRFRPAPLTRRRQDQARNVISTREAMTTPASCVPAVIWPSNKPHMVLASVTAPTNDVMTCLLRVSPTTGRRTRLFRFLGVFKHRFLQRR